MLIVLSFTACLNNEEIVTYLNKNGHTYTLSSVKTPNGSKIQTCYYQKSLGKEEIDAINDYFANVIKERKWDAVKKGEPALYNCHSYAWYSQSSNNKHWINEFQIDPKTGDFTNEGNLSKYWKDKSYSFVVETVNSTCTIPSVVPNGSIVYYAKGDHSARKSSSQKFVSKWGVGGLYEHSPKCAPYNYSTLRYYKKNK